MVHFSLFRMSNNSVYVIDFNVSKLITFLATLYFFSLSISIFIHNCEDMLKDIFIEQLLIFSLVHPVLLSDHLYLFGSNTSSSFGIKNQTYLISTISLFFVFSSLASIEQFI